LCLADSQHVRRFVNRHILIFQHVCQHDVGDREGVHDRACDDTHGAVNGGGMEQLGHDAVVAEKCGKTDAVRNRGDEHGQSQEDTEDPLAGNVSAHHAERQHIRQKNADPCGDQGENHRVFQGISEQGGGEDRLKVRQAYARKHTDDGKDHKDQKDERDSQLTGGAEGG